MATPAVKRALASFYCPASRTGGGCNVFYVYVLLCGDGRLYTGYSTNLRRRIKEHESGQVFSTKGRLPVNLIFYEAFSTAEDAKRREGYLKTAAGKRALKLMSREWFRSINS